jgi:tetratricopeptide (TPR) repeat protein
MGVGAASRWIGSRIRTLAGLVALTAISADASADDKKKKPGLFDFETWKAPVTREREAAGHFAPHTLDLAPAVPAGPEPRRVQLRVYADRDYRSLVVRWQSKMRRQIERLNAVTGPVFNVKFEIESLRDWDRTHFGVDFNHVLDELMKLDEAREVDWVIGLATPLREVASSLHQIGYASLCSRHFLMRGMDDEQESLAIDREFQLLPIEERRRLYGDRKSHKEIVVFLHEWGHTMGLLHHEDRASVMNPAYDSQQRVFTDWEKQVMAMVIERRLGKRGEPYPETAELASMLAAAPADEGSNKERAELTAFVRDRAKAVKTNADITAARTASAADFTQQEVDAFNKAVAAVNADRREQAWALLAPVVRSVAARKTSAGTWTRLAELEAGIGAFTAAEDAIARAGSGDAEARKTAERVESARYRMALPLDARKLGVPPDKEPAYAGAFSKAAEAVASAPIAAAQTHVAEMAKAFPGAPGVDVLTCDLELRAKRVAQANKSCEAAVAKFPGATRAHYLLGVIAANARRDAVAEQHFRRVIALDPREEGAWRSLAAMYRTARSKQRLARLRDEHQALLSSPLPE